MSAFVSVQNSLELRATVIAIHSAPAAIRAAVRAENRSILAPQWRAELGRRSASVPQTRTLVDTARVTASDTSVVMTSASSKRRVTSGGLIPYDDGKGFEFGAGTNKVAEYRSRRGSKTFTVRRHTARQMPPPRSSGYLVYPTFATIAPRAAALWAQTSVKIIADALAGKSSHG